MTIIKPVTSEKAVRLLELENTIMFEVSRKDKKPEVKKEIESLLGVKVDNMRTLLKQNKKFVYVRLNKKNLAIDLATKLGMM